MSKQYTPGPWNIDTSIEYEISVVAPWSYFNSPVDSAVFGDYRGGLICTAHWNTGVPTKRQAVINCRLISAAPDLLEALEGILIDMGVDPDASPEGYDKKTQKALAAIKKAKGGSYE